MTTHQYYHISEQPLNALRSVVQTVGNKPMGLWLCHTATAWQDATRRLGIRTNRATITHQITLLKSVRLLRINSIESWESVLLTYGIGHCRVFGDIIDWAAVARDYDGVEVTGDVAEDDNWAVECLCIWNADVMSN